ncbi:hypothetical protein VULLAG_LOCUS4089 [Vulpes lagopus]
MGDARLCSCPCSGSDLERETRTEGKQSFSSNPLRQRQWRLLPWWPLHANEQTHCGAFAGQSLCLVCPARLGSSCPLQVQVLPGLTEGTPTPAVRAHPVGGQRELPEGPSLSGRTLDWAGHAGTPGLLALLPCLSCPPEGTPLGATALVPSGEPAGSACVEQGPCGWNPGPPSRGIQRVSLKALPGDAGPVLGLCGPPGLPWPPSSAEPPGATLGLGDVW